MGLVGFIISISTTVVAARYIALFLQAGSYAGYVDNIKTFPRRKPANNFSASSCSTHGSARPSLVLPQNAQ
jgi:hypothetical protein